MQHLVLIKQKEIQQQQNQFETKTDQLDKKIKNLEIYNQTLLDENAQLKEQD